MLVPCPGKTVLESVEMDETTSVFVVELEWSINALEKWLASEASPMVVEASGKLELGVFTLANLVPDSELCMADDTAFPDGVTRSELNAVEMEVRVKIQDASELVLELRGRVALSGRTVWYPRSKLEPDTEAMTPPDVGSAETGPEKRDEANTGIAGLAESLADKTVTALELTATDEPGTSEPVIAGEEGF